MSTETTSNSRTTNPDTKQETTTRKAEAAAGEEEGENSTTTEKEAAAFDRKWPEAFDALKFTSGDLASLEASFETPLNTAAVPEPPEQAASAFQVHPESLSPSPTDYQLIVTATPCLTTRGFKFLPSNPFVPEEGDLESTPKQRQEDEESASLSDYAIASAASLPFLRPSVITQLASSQLLTPQFGIITPLLLYSSASSSLPSPSSPSSSYFSSWQEKEENEKSSIVFLPSATPKIIKPLDSISSIFSKSLLLQPDISSQPFQYQIVSSRWSDAFPDASFLQSTAPQLISPTKTISPASLISSSNQEDAEKSSFSPLPTPLISNYDGNQVIHDGTDLASSGFFSFASPESRSQLSAALQSSPAINLLFSSEDAAISVAASSSPFFASSLPNSHLETPPLMTSSSIFEISPLVPEGSSKDAFFLSSPAFDWQSISATPTLLDGMKSVVLLSSQIYSPGT